jgi:DNA-binding transcriptional LysR family regulator
VELQQLRYFLVVANHLNLSQAAETLCISQPALSKMMARLQQQLSVQLYVRKGRGIALTDAGIALRSRAESIIYRMDEAEQLMTDMRAGLSGHVRIGAGPSFLTQILPEAIAELAEKQPNVRYTIREGTTDELCPPGLGQVGPYPGQPGFRAGLQPFAGRRPGHRHPQ